MVVCKKCGIESIEGTEFCPSCGAALISKIKFTEEPTTRTIPPVQRKTYKENREASARTKLKEKKKTKEEREQGKKERDKLAPSPFSPHIKKKTKVSTKAFVLPLIILAVIIIVAAFFTFSKPIDSCTEDWKCGTWGSCIEGIRERICLDMNECGEQNNELPTQEGCTVVTIPGVVNETENITTCAEIGDYCENVSDCCFGNCTHHLCINATTYCGDGYCDLGEDCASCSYDCGECLNDRELEQNVFTDPLEFGQEGQFMDDGYVVLIYVYKDSCDSCFEPVHIENQLRDLAASFKDLFVLQILDIQEHNFQASKYANIGLNTYTPLISVDGSKFYGTKLGLMLQDGDIMADMASLICANSNYCVFENNRIVRTS
jgi:hypothetical protein